MGTLIYASCDCGYRAEELTPGVGMAGPQSERVIAICPVCREATTVRTASRPLRCEDCGSPVSALPGEEALLEEGARFPCPRCEATTLAFHFAGLWD